MAHVYVGIDEDDIYQSIKLIDENDAAFRQVLWGDWLTLDGDSKDEARERIGSEDWLWVRWAWKDTEKRKRLRIREKHTADTRPLEIIFVDVGIGDGAVLITPERAAADDTDNASEQERILVIDAGKSKHMREFLDERFKAYRDGFHFHAAIITHPDADHYYGFNRIFSTAKISFDHVYHNGIVELQSTDDFTRLGGTRTDPLSQVRYLQKTVTDDAEMRLLFDPAQGRTNWYAKVIAKGIQKGNVGDYKMLGTNIGDPEDERYWMPGFGPSGGRPYTIEVLGPWVEYPFAPGDPALRLFDEDVGKTKNGHSILLRLEYGKFSVLFGGDLNKASEMFLLQRYADIDSWPSTRAGRDEMVKNASKRLSSDVMKSCHHGSSDVTDEFLRAVEPAAFVISSGDQDANYVHPRPDLLGRLGKYGKGDSPVLLSTELQRSTRDIDNSDEVRKIEKWLKAWASCDADIHAEPNFEAQRNDAVDTLIESLADLALPSVAVDGAIYVKTDGDLLMTAFKKETTDANSKWFYYAYELTGDGTLELIAREDSH